MRLSKRKTIKPIKTKPKTKPRLSVEQQLAREWMLTKLKESGLDRADADALGYEAFTAAESKTLSLSREGQGFKLPYRDADGSELSMFRYRFTETAFAEGFLKGAKRPKYEQPAGTDPEPYFPAIEGIDWKKVKSDANIALVITEGEKKSACVTKYVSPCVGLGGVWSFGQKRKGYSLLPALEAFNWVGRDVYICYDSDAATNSDVVKAEGRLAVQLVDQGALVRIVRLPQRGNVKQGADDFIMNYGAEAFTELLHTTELFALSRELHALSEQYGIIRDTGLIIEYATGTLHRAKTFIEVIEAPRKLFINPKTRLVSADAIENTLPVSAAARWIESKSRAEFSCLDYEPGAGVVTAKGGFNGWCPSGVCPVAGDTSLFDELIAHQVADAVERDYFLRWCAAPLQHPGLRSNVAVMLWGSKQGTGKTLLGATIGRLHGLSNFIEIGQQELASSFNDWQANKTFVMGSELCGERDSRAFADKLKSIITADHITINKKHQPLYTLPNMANFFLTSNHANALFMDDHARRFMVIHASRPPLPQKFYSRYCEWLDKGGLGMVLHKLLALDLVDFNAKAAAPTTEARDAMVAAGRSDLAAWCHALKDDPDTILVFDNVPLPYRFYTSSDLLRVYERTNANSGVNVQQLGNMLSEVGLLQAHKNPVSIPGTNMRLRLWVVRDQLKAANMTPDQIGNEYARRLRPTKVSVR
jgi:hypothetical protein